MKYTLKFRIWHWLNAVIVLGLLSTVFLRKTFLSWRTNSEILMNKLSEFGILITEEQAKILAKSIRAGMWEWHIILGYLLTLFIIYRIYLYFKDTSTREKFSELSVHKKGVQLLYYLVYVTLFFMSISGLSIHFYEALHLTKVLVHDIKEVHELVFNIILIFVPIHIVGVVIADSTTENGLISRMINGKK
ncbi:MAG: cytochrome b/b6 domain-containing protein [Sulfurimonas sp.]